MGGCLFWEFGFGLVFGGGVWLGLCCGGGVCESVCVCVCVCVLQFCLYITVQGSQFDKEVLLFARLTEYKQRMIL